MPGLPSDLRKRLCAALIDSGYCDSADALRAVCVDERLIPWRNRLPDARDPQSRAEAVIDALHDKYTDAGENALALLLYTLSGHFDPGDARHATLADLAGECETATLWAGIDVASLAYARLHTLPSPPADFIGREDELAQLLEAVETGGATISGLRGMGGVGKTTLALKLAERLRERYPDAQFYLDLRGVDPEPLTPAEVMTTILRAYHPTARLPEDEAQLQSLYCSVLNSQRALLLLDNASNKAQLLPLLPPASCLLLVTSRQRFTLPGLRPLDLDALPKPEAEALLREIAPRVGEHAGDLAELCGCLPAALRWAGEALDATTMRVPRFLERLQAERKLLEPAEASLRLSYDLLPPDLQALWRQLSVFPADFGWLGAAAVWDMAWDTEEGRAATEDTLDALVRRSLILSGLVSDRARVGGDAIRYSLHDLARLWAAEQATDDERVTAAYRHAAHYERVLRATNDLYLLGNKGILAGLALFDREAANIHAGFAMVAIPGPLSQRIEADAKSNKETDEFLAPLRPGGFILQNALCNAYPNAGVALLSLRMPPGERVTWLEAAMLAACLLGDRAAEGAHLGNLGIAYADLGDVRRAIRYYVQWLDIAREIGDRRGEGNALGSLGLAYADLGDTLRAIEFYAQQLEIAREIGDRRGEGNALGNLGLAHADLGDIRRAIEFYKRQLDIVREIGDRRGEGNALGNLGSAYAALGEVHQAIEYQKQTLVISREIGDRRGEGNVLNNLGLAYANLGDTCSAIKFYKQSLKIKHEIGDQRGGSNTCWNLGLVYEEEGRYAEACESMRVTVEFERAISHPNAEPDAQRLAEVCAKSS